MFPASAKDSLSLNHQETPRMANSEPDVSAKEPLSRKWPITKNISSIHSFPVKLIYSSPTTDMTEWLSLSLTTDEELSLTMDAGHFLLVNSDFLQSICDTPLPSELTNPRNQNFLDHHGEQTDFILWFPGIPQTNLQWVRQFMRICTLVVSDSLWPRGLQPARLLCPWDSPGKSTGVGCHFLVQHQFTCIGSYLLSAASCNALSNGGCLYSPTLSHTGPTKGEQLPVHATASRPSSLPLLENLWLWVSGHQITPTLFAAPVCFLLHRLSSPEDCGLLLPFVTALLSVLDDFFPLSLLAVNFSPSVRPSSTTFATHSHGDTENLKSRLWRPPFLASN